MENNIIKNFNDLNNNITKRRIDIEALYNLSDDVKKFASLQKEITELEDLKSTLEPQYYTEMMSTCEHVFAECYYKHYEYENKKGSTDFNKYNLVFEHYCLKCGCSTRFLGKTDLEKLGIADTPTAKVAHTTQIGIAKNSSNHSIIDCEETSFKKIVLLWEKIKKENADLSFEEQVDVFKYAIESIKPNVKNEPKKLFLRRPIVFEQRHVKKRK